MAINHRTDMLASVIREAIAPALRQAPPQCGIVTIVRVDVSTDSSYATIYISALHEPELALEYLQGERGPLQRRVADASHRYRVPKVRFRIDRAAEEGSRIDALLQAAVDTLPPEAPQPRRTRRKS